jgi:hypothetical protein
VIPNRLQIIYTFVWQTLSTGRDIIFSLSGPNMVSYIGGLQTSLSYMYDAIRVELPELPETLTVYVVPVAQSRFLTHVDRRDSLDAVLDVISWYERQASEAKARAQTELLRISAEYPEFTRGIEYGDFMSQYDLKSPEDLYIPEWLLSVPLGRLRKFYDTMATATATRSAA